jgi:ribosome modulation factor
MMERRADMARAWFEGYMAAMNGQDSDENPYADDLVWQALDGTVWTWAAMQGVWRGWEPGIQDAWTATPDEFRRRYPDGPTWDG